MKYKVLLTTSGIGSRLGELTNHTNKSLVRINDKPVISHIIEYYPDNIEFVITLGHYGNQIKDFLTLTYPNKKFNFVTVKNFDGPGSSLGLSMLTSKKELQCPFIFHACDTIVNEKIPNDWIISKFNFVIGNKKENSNQYRTIRKIGNNLIEFLEKGEIKFTGDKNISYIGLTGIYEYQKFWNSLEHLYMKDSDNKSLSDCHVINHMIFNDHKFKVIEFKEWYDIGNSTELLLTRKKFSKNFTVLDKSEENIFIFEDFVIKFFKDKKIVKDRIERSTKIKNNIPKIIDYKDNFFKYEFVNGELFSRSVDENKFKKFLNWMKNNVWVPIKNIKDFDKDCYEFYHTKTKKRINNYVSKSNIKSEPRIINNIKCDSIENILDKLNDNILKNGIPCNFHGDCILDNVIETNKSFKLIDWRQNFNDKLYGDVYYDLAKLNHNLTFNHDLVNNGHYFVNYKNNNIEVDILCSNKLKCCQEILHKFIIDNNYDLNKVKLLTSLIWINMAPLHDLNLGMFLMMFGQWNLNKTYRELI